MEEELAKLKAKLEEEEKSLGLLEESREKIKVELDGKDDYDIELKRQLRNLDHEILMKEADVFVLKKRIKQVIFKIEIVSLMTEIELEEDIDDLQSILSNVDHGLKNKETGDEADVTKDNESVKDKDNTKEQTTCESDSWSDKLQGRVDVPQECVDQEKKEIREIRRASGIPDPVQLAEIERLAKLNEASSKTDDG